MCVGATLPWGPPRRRAIPHLSPPRPPSCAHNRVCAAAAKGLGVERAHLLRWGAALSGCRGSVRCRRGRGRGGLLLSNTAGGWRGAWGGTCRGMGWVAESPPLMVGGGGSGRVSWQPVLTFTPSIAAAASKEVGSWQRSVPRGGYARTRTLAVLLSRGLRAHLLVGVLMPRVC